MTTPAGPPTGPPAGIPPSAPPGPPPDRPPPTLATGTTLSARVLEGIPGGLYRLAVDDAVLLARTTAHLTPGQHLTLEVVAAGPPPLLRPLPAEGHRTALLQQLLRTVDLESAAGISQDLAILRQTLPDGELAGLVDRWLQILRPTILAPPLDPARFLLAALVLRADPGLPDLLARIQQGLKTGGKDEHRPLATKVARQAQFHHLLATAVPPIHLWPLDLGEEGNGVWFASQEDQRHRIVLFLHLSRLGPVEAAVEVAAGGCRVTVACTGEDVRRHLEEHLPQVAENLAALPLPATIQVVEQPCRLTADLKTMLERCEAGAPLALVDLRI